MLCLAAMARLQRADARPTYRRRAKVAAAAFLAAHIEIYRGQPDVLAGASGNR
jgi:hypothetical protein